MADSQVDVNVIQPLKSKPIEAGKVTVKGGNGLYSASSSLQAQWGVLRNWRHPIVWGIQGISHVSSLLVDFWALTELNTWCKVAALETWLEKETSVSSSSPVVFFLLSFTLRLRMELGGWKHHAEENLGLGIWSISVQAEHSNRVSGTHDPCVQTPLQVKSQDKWRLHADQHTVFSVYEPNFSHQHERYLKHWKNYSPIVLLSTMKKKSLFGFVWIGE